MWCDARARAMFEPLGFTELGPRFYRSKRHLWCELEEVLKLGVVPTGKA